MLLLTFLTSNCGGNDTAQEVTFNQVFSRPSEFHNRIIMIEGFYFHGFELVVLSEKIEFSGHAAGHLIPRGEMIWIEGGIPLEVYDKLYQQSMMGPTERYGKIRINGRFQYGGNYGHLGAYTYQITAAKVELLPWSPPE